MKHSVFVILILLFILVVSTVFLDHYFFNSKLSHFVPILIKTPASYTFTKLESTRFFLKKLVEIKKLITDNDELKKENFELVSKLADYENLKSENNFLRSILKISPRFENKIVYASVFNFQIGSNGYSFLLNKGAKDEIREKDIVITEEGVLVGKIEKVYDNFSKVIVVNDPNFSVMAKVIGSETSGIAKGALDQGMYLDLIIQSDPITESDTLISSGMDFFPPALIIGKVSHVEANETDIFKKVKIKPALEDVKIGRVLIVRKN